MTTPTVTLPIDLSNVHVMEADEKPWLIVGEYHGTTVYVVQETMNDGPRVLSFVFGNASVVLGTERPPEVPF